MTFIETATGSIGRSLILEYSERLLEKGNFATRYSHNKRFSTLAGILRGGHYNLALDWGCADGFMLKSLYEQGVIENGIGIDNDPETVRSCKQSFESIKNFSFFTPDELKRSGAQKKCDLVICTETLEHVANPKEVLDGFLKITDGQSTIIVSVPIEVGPALLVKQTFRFLANIRKNYGYDTYRLQELIKAGIFWDVKTLSAQRIDGHKGFDYRSIEALFAPHFSTVKKIYSPFPVLNELLNATILWVLKRK